MTEPTTERVPGPEIDLTVYSGLVPDSYVAPPDILTMAEILADQALLVAKEHADKLLLDSIGSHSAQGLKPRFVEWITKGCQSGFALLSLDIKPPERCSDGVTRGLADYIEFCSGKTIAAQVELLQAKLPDITLSYANICGMTTVVVVTA